MKSLPRSLCLILLALLAFASIGCQVNPITGKNELNIYSRAEEKAMGDQAAPQVLAELGGEYPDPALKAYVNRVGQKVAQAGRDYIRSQGRDFPDWEFQFYVVNDSMINAFALPGGHVFVTRGILAEMEDEAQLAGLLGHECAHVFLSHGAVQQTTQLLTNLGVATLGATLSDDHSWIAGAAGMAANLHSLSHSRSDESASDRWGMEFLVSSRYEADGLIHVMEMLQHASSGSHQPEFLSTHPNPDNRIAALTNLRDTKYANAKVEHGFIKGRAPFQNTIIKGIEKHKDAYELADQGDKHYQAAASAQAANDDKAMRKHLFNALSSYKAAANMAPKHGLLQRKLGQTYLMLGDQRALNTIARARSLQGADFMEDYLYGLASERQSNHPSALSAYESALRKVNGYLPALAGAARTSEAKGDRQRAIAYYQAITRVTPQDSALNKAASTKFKALSATPK